MDRDGDKMAESIINLTLEILFRLTGEEYTVVKKTSSERCQAPVSEGWGGILSPISRPTPHIPIHEKVHREKILELTNKIIELLTGEVPIKCQDVAVYFSMEEREYLDGKKDLYKHIMMADHQPPVKKERTTPERCPSPLHLQDHLEEHHNVPQDDQVDRNKVPSRMYRDMDKMAESIINLTLEILFRLTGEEYTVVKKTSSERCQVPVSEGRGGNLRPISRPIHEQVHREKILELTNKMIELLTGEVHIRCQDVAVYFSMEESEYLEGHKDLYKNVMMEDHQPLTSPVKEERTTLERCPSPPLLQDGSEDHYNVPQDDQILNPAEDLNIIKTEDTYVMDDEQIIEDIPTDNHPDYCTGSSEEHLIYLDIKEEDCGVQEDTHDEYAFISDVSLAFHSKDLSADDFKPIRSSDLSLTVQQNKNHIRSVQHQRTHTGKKTFSCSECGKCFNWKSHLLNHERIHTGEKPFSCSECEKRFNRKSHLVKHKKIHTGEKPFLCSECGKCFIDQSHLVIHKRIHTGDKLFVCSECGKCFMDKSHLVVHQRIHTGEKPFSCLECRKCFTDKSNLVKHQRIHTGEKPFSCSECEKRFNRKSHLVKHKKIHTGDRLFSCSECGKCFMDKSHLVVHERTHTGEKPFSCLECGKCFADKSNLVKHQRIHAGEKPY